MKVSVVIPAHNEEKYIGKCLQSLVKQTVQADEIIVVNNNSTDNTAEIVSTFPQVTLLNQHNPGVIVTRDHGFDAAQGDIILRTDADTVVDPEWVKSHKEYYEAHPECDAITGSAYYDGIPDSLNYILYTRFVMSYYTVLGYHTLIGPNMSLRKSMWQKIHTDVCQNADEVHEDMDIAIHIHEAGGTIAFVPTAIVHSSTRRLVSKPQSFFLEYPHRLIKMLKKHHIKAPHLNSLPMPHFKAPDFLQPLKKKQDETF